MDPTPTDRPLMVAWNLSGCRVVVVGGGSIAHFRVKTLLTTGANITVVAPAACPEITQLHEQGALQLESRPFSPEDVQGATTVLGTVDDPSVSKHIARVCGAAGIPVTIADQPELCDYIFPAVHRDGPIQIAVSTSGYGPGLAARIRDEIAAGLNPAVAQAIQQFSRLRRQIRTHAPNEMKRRMSWLRSFAQQASWEELSQMTDGTIDEAVRTFVQNRPPTERASW